jgi:hypothetical protein
VKMKYSGFTVKFRSIGLSGQREWSLVIAWRWKTSEEMDSAITIPPFTNAQFLTLTSIDLAEDFNYVEVK